MRIIIYTDGSCNNRLPDNERFGGWAFSIGFRNQKRINFSGQIPYPTTSQRAELTAVLKSLNELLQYDLQNIEILIHSDSAYIVNCFLQSWWKGWQEMDYLGIKNKDLWQLILRKISYLQKEGNKVKFIKVKGHSGNKYNEIVDNLASSARKGIKEITNIEEFKN